MSDGGAAPDRPDYILPKARGAKSKEELAEARLALETARMPPKARARFLMLEGWTDTRIAAELKVSRRLIYSWRNSDGFAKRLEVEIKLRHAHAGVRLRALVSAAIDVLREIMVSGRYPVSVRLKAAELVIEKCGIGKEDVQAQYMDQEAFNATIERLAEQRAAEMVRQLAMGQQPMGFVTPANAMPTDDELDGRVPTGS